MFSDDLNEIPSERKVEFTIDVVLNFAPISKILYRMAPKEL